MTQEEGLTETILCLGPAGQESWKRLGRGGEAVLSLLPGRS